MMSIYAAKTFDILAISLKVLYNFYNLTKLFLDLYLTKFLIFWQNYFSV